MTDTTQDKISYIGARLREKSTYGGLAVAIGMLLPLLTKYFPQLADTNVATIVSALSDLGIGLGLFIGIFLPEKGSPAGVAKTTDTVVKVLLVAFALSFLLANGSANAQPARIKKPVDSGPVFTGDLGADIKNGFKGDPNNPNAGIKLTGNLKTDALAVWKQIQSASHADLVYASLMAGAAGTPASKTRKQCWDAIIAVNEQSNGANLQGADGKPATKPDPSLFTDIETAAEIIDNLSPQGALYTSCSGAAQLFQANVIQFISAAVTGVAGLAKLTPIPGL